MQYLLNSFLKRVPDDGKRAEMRFKLLWSVNKSNPTGAEMSQCNLSSVALKEKYFGLTLTSAAEEHRIVQL